MISRRKFNSSVVSSLTGLLLCAPFHSYFNNSVSRKAAVAYIQWIAMAIEGAKLIKNHLGSNKNPTGEYLSIIIEKLDVINGKIDLIIEAIDGLSEDIIRGTQETNILGRWLQYEEIMRGLKKEYPSINARKKALKSVNLQDDLEKIYEENDFASSVILTNYKNWELISVMSLSLFMAKEISEILEPERITKSTVLQRLASFRNWFYQVAYGQDENLYNKLKNSRVSRENVLTDKNIPDWPGHPGSIDWRAQPFNSGAMNRRLIIENALKGRESTRQKGFNVTFNKTDEAVWLFENGIINYDEQFTLTGSGAEFDYNMRVAKNSNYFNSLVNLTEVIQVYASNLNLATDCINYADIHIAQNS